MTRRTRLLGLALGAMSGALMAQQATSSPSTTSVSGTQTVTGSIVQYSGSSIVLKTADGRTSTYVLGPNVPLPPGVAIGRDVTLSTQSGTGGSQTVSSVQVKTDNPADTSPSMAPQSPDPRQPATYTSTETASPMAAFGQASSAGSSGQSASGPSSAVPPTSGLASGTSQATTTQIETSPSAAGISGKVTAYSPKQSITIVEPGKGVVTYTIDAHSALPQDVAVGKTVTITTTTAQGSSTPVVKTVTTTTRTTKTTAESHPR